MNDGFGFSLLEKRVADVYTALANDLPDNGGAFGSLQLLLEEEKRYRASEQFAKDRQYWLESLTEVAELVSLADKPPVTSSGALRETAYLEPARTETLRMIAGRAECTLPQIITAATAVYLHRMTGAEEVILGLALTGRAGAIARSTPGMLSNALPLRVMTPPSMTFIELIRQVGRKTRRGLRHQRYRSEDLSRELGLAARNQKLFGPTVNFLSSYNDLNFAGHRGRIRHLSTGWVEDISVVVYDVKDEDLQIYLEANPNTYTAEDLRAHQGRLLRLLESIVTDVDAEIGRIELLSGEERRQILEEWNETRREIPRPTLPELFEEQVRRSPEAVAVVCREQGLNYRELNERANRLARLLIGEGVGPEDVVALTLPRSVEMIVALLGVLKAGAAYLPIDPDYPPERIAFMLEDAGPACVIAVSETARRLPNCRRQFIIDEEETVEALTRSLTTNPGDLERARPLLPSHPAYVIYTSGSTGVPKGVIVTHLGIPNLAVAQVRQFGITSESRIL